MTKKTPSSALRKAKRIVIKVGSSLVTNEGRGLDEQAIGEWCRQIAHLMADDARSSWSPAVPLPRA